MSKNANVNSGLTLSLTNEFTSKNVKTIKGIINFLSRFIIVLSLSAGGIFTFSSMMNIRQIEWINYAVIVIASLILTICYKSFKKHWLVLLLSFISVVAAGVFMLTPVETGFKLLYDNVIQSIYSAMNWTPPDPIIHWDDSYISNTTYCMAMFSVVITSLASFFAVGKTHFIGAFLITFPLFELGAAFGCVSELIPFAILLSGWAAMLTLHISNRQKTHVKHQNADKINTYKQYVYKSKTERFGGSSLVALTAVFLCFTVIANTLTSAEVSRSASLEKFREKVKSTALNTYDLITGYDHDASLKDGNLKTLGDRKVLDREYATLEIPNVNQNLYLKGYVGSIYTGTAWEDFDDATYENLENIKKMISSIPTVIGDSLYENYQDNLKSAEFKLYNFRREKDYIYAPSGVVSSENIFGYRDLYPATENKDSYSYTAYYDSLDYMNFPYTKAYNSAEFLSAWNEYCDFVQANYTLLPEGIDEVAKLGMELKGDTVYKTVDNVRAFLSENTEYSDSVQKLPKNKDFTSYFLFEKGVGYSAHFATAATVMLRSLGVPARYVEGFYISKENIENADGDNSLKTVTITDGNSHAWIEIFDTQYGWIPIEVTNGFYENSFEKAMKTAQKQAKNDQKSPEKIEKTPENSGQNLTSNEENEQKNVEKNTDEGTEQVSKSENKKINILLIFGILVGAVFVMIISAVITLIVRRSKILKNRQKVFNSTNYRKQVILSFELLKKMLNFNKTDISKIYKFDDFKKIIEENFEENSENEFSVDKLLKNYEKAMFSKLLITEEDASEVLDFIDELGYSLYSQLKFISRLKWKFINVLS